MLKHLADVAINPTRVVILGAQGFVGATAARLLHARDVAVRPIGRSEIDLSSANATQLLAGELRSGDSLIIASARAPVKGVGMLRENIAMMENICNALTVTSPRHVVYISSDAVYRDSNTPLTEGSCAEPGSLHGAMHLARELMLKSVVRVPLAILRPSLLYGAADPHNGYGPNQFRRLAASGQDIVLFGEGEERRDHVIISDLAEVIFRVLAHRSQGILNVATGEVMSFREIAERIAAMATTKIAIRSRARSGPMPHNGYRPFDAAACRTAFPDFEYTGLATGLEKVGLT